MEIYELLLVEAGADFADRLELLRLLIPDGEKVSAVQPLPLAPVRASADVSIFLPKMCAMVW